MNDAFTPSKQLGTIVLASLLVILAGAMLFLLVTGSRVPQDATSGSRISLGFGLLIPIIYLLNRLYELLTLQYELSRSALGLRWGLRQETIPLEMVKWVRLATDFNNRLPLPFSALPGCVIGHRAINGLGSARFLATERQNLVIIALAEQAVVISPNEPAAFVQQYERIYELGSLEKVPFKSTDVGTLWRLVWADRTARGLILLGGFTTVLLWAVVLGLGARYPQVTWVTLESVPASQLLLLAILGSFTWAIDLILGLLLYLLQRISPVMVYCLWGMAALSSVLLMLAALLMSL